MRILSFIAFAIAAVAGKAVDPNIELPSSLKICRRNDPQRDECIKNSIQNFLPAWQTSNKDSKFEFPSIDPFFYDAVTFKYKNSNILSGDFTLRNVNTYGMSRGQVKDVKSEFTDESMTLQAELLFPKIFTSGNYKSNMTFNLIRLQSKGQYNVSMIDVKAKWNIKGKLETINGEKFMKINSFDILPEANDMKVSVSGLFQDATLNQIANDFFNQYWRLLYQEMIPETRKQWEPILLDITNKFFSQVPFRRLLLKD